MDSDAEEQDRQGGLPNKPVGGLELKTATQIPRVGRPPKVSLPRSQGVLETYLVTTRSMTRTLVSPGPRPVYIKAGYLGGLGHETFDRVLGLANPLPCNRYPINTTQTGHSLLPPSRGAEPG